MTVAKRRPCGSDGGAILLEVVLALAIFVSAGIAILSATGQAGDGLAMLREKVRAADLARSAMAKIEAGIADPIVLSGPVPVWRDEEAPSAAFDDSLPPETGWELAIDTEPAGVAGDGLTRVSVTAKRRGVSLYTMHQFVRLSRREGR